MNISSSQDYPYERPPPGTSPNFINPTSRGPATVAVCYSFILLMWPILLLRLYSRILVIRRFGWDDAASFFAAIGATANAASIIYCIKRKVLGPHGWDVRAVAWTSTVIKVDILGTGTTTYSLSILLAKLSLFLLYHRIFALNASAKAAIYFGIVANCTFYLASSIAHLVICVPRSVEGWTSPQYAARCYKFTVMAIIQGIFGLISDLYIFVLPLPLLWRLQMPLKEKPSFSPFNVRPIVEFVDEKYRAIVASSITLYYRVLETWHSDNAWNQTPASGLALVELTIGVICGSVPHLPALYRRHATIISCISHLIQEFFSSMKLKSDNHDSKPETSPPNIQFDTEILGSIKGDGKFVTSGRFSRLWGRQISTGQASVDLSEDSSATRREFYEAPMNTHLVSSGDPARCFGEMECPVTATDEKATRDQSNTPRKGYWDIMSFFRSSNQRSYI